MDLDSRAKEKGIRVLMDTWVIVGQRVSDPSRAISTIAACT